MGNPVAMLQDYVLPLSPEATPPLNLKGKKKREKFKLNSNKIQSIIEKSTTEINDSINFNRRVFADRGTTGTKWLRGDQERMNR
jgi:hypothetical protein